jgi:hypothetical protein
MPVYLSQFFTKLRLVPLKSEKTVFAANAKSFCACRKHTKTGKILRLPVQMPHHMELLRTSNSLLPGEDLKSNSRDMPGGDVEVSN